MAGRMTFAIAVKLLTDRFKTGVKEMRAGFSSLQAQVVTFAAACSALDISIGGIVRSLIDVTRETGRAQTLMRNASADTAEYAENMRFAAATADKYGVYVNDIARNFAKFRAAAGIAGMTLGEQRQLFDDLTRACAAFGLTADETNGVFLAVTQMMGKGKIQAEELRGQLGERMPIAMQAMAKAAGTTVAGLDDIMKKGELMSAQVLPAFGRALTEMLPNVDTDNIETAIGRMQTAFQKLVEGFGLGDAMKDALKSVTGMVDAAADNVRTVVLGVVALVAGTVANGAARIYANLVSVGKSIEAQADVTAARLQAATARRVKAEQALEATRLKMATATSAQIVKLREKEVRQIAALEKAKTAEAAASERARVAAAESAAVSTSTAWGRARTAFIVGCAKMKAAFISLWAAFAPMVIVSGIVMIVGKLMEWKREMDEIDGRMDTFREGLAAAGSDNAELTSLRATQAVMNDLTASAEARTRAMSELAEKLDLVQGKNETDLEYQKRINAEVAKRIKMLQLQAQSDFLKERMAAAQKKIGDYSKEYNFEYSGGVDDETIRGLKNLKGVKSREKGLTGYSYLGYDEVIGGFGGAKRAKDFTSAVDELDAAVKGSAAVMGEIAKMDVSKAETPTAPEPAQTKPTDAEKELNRARERYNQALREIEYDTARGAMSEEERARATDELNRETLKSLRTSAHREVRESQFAEELAAAAEQYTDEKRMAAERARISQEYAEQMAEITSEYAAGLIDTRTMQERAAELADEFAATAAHANNASGALDDMVNDLKETSAELRQKMSAAAQSETLENFEPVKRTGRDKTFDYRNKALETLKEDAKEAEEHAEALTRQLEELKSELESKGGELIPEAVEQLERMREEIEKTTEESDNLAEALKKAEINEDIKKSSKRLRDTLMDGTTDIVGNIDGIVNAVEQLKEAMENGTGWEKFMAGFSIVKGAIDTLRGIVNMIQTLQVVMQMLSAARAAASATEASTAATEAAAKVAASKTATTAAITEMAAESTAAYAHIPYIGVELAAAQIAAMQGLISAASASSLVAGAFADGGVVGGGSPTGDKLIARVNSGEMILNTRQQAALFRLLDNGGMGGGATVESVKVRGADLWLTMRNYGKKTGKKL